MNWIVRLAISGLSVALLITGISIARKALKMKAQGKENLQLYVGGWTLIALGSSLLILCVLECLFVNAPLRWAA